MCYLLVIVHYELCIVLRSFLRLNGYLDAELWIEIVFYCRSYAVAYATHVVKRHGHAFIYERLLAEYVAFPMFVEFISEYGVKPCVTISIVRPIKVVHVPSYGERQLIGYRYGIHRGYVLGESCTLPRAVAERREHRSAEADVQAFMQLPIVKAEPVVRIHVDISLTETI